MCAGLSTSPNRDLRPRPMHCVWLLVPALLMFSGCERNGRSDAPPTLSISAPGSGSGTAGSDSETGPKDTSSGTPASTGSVASEVDSLFAFADPPPRSTSDGTAAASESADKPAEAKPRRQNRLARETSPYLLLHAHNPVDWYPWGPEAFEKAAAENKPIFLSVGYSSCYWCHVMERLVFQNEEIAAYMNQHFINIKVDREERPDIDDIYMTALQIYLQLAGSGGSGGWPLSMFLTPDGKPIAGGTYFPPDDMENRPGFPSVMSRINDAWQNRRDDLTSVADTLTRLVQRQMLPGLTLEKTEICRELVDQAVSGVIQSHDPEFGGVDFDFNNPEQPKFPVPTRLALLQYDIRENKNAAAERALFQTLDQMAAGGIHDHLGGGFHRYSTDRQWLVPHFEKMLYDNAQLADVYLDAYRATQKTHYRDVAEDILNFLLTDMLDENGAFHSAIDAENDGIEGKYYVWSKEQVEQALGPQSTVFVAAYGMDQPSEFEHGYVLHMPRSIPDLAADLKIDPAELRLRLFDMKKRLLEVRSRRESPLKDDKILTSWNGLTIRTLVNAGIVLNERRYLDAADRAMMFILTSMRDEQGRLLRTSRGRTARLNAYLDDYAFIIDALLTMHFATRDEKWLTAARRLADDQLQMFHDDKNGGFFFTSHHHEQLLARTRNGWDAVLPSGNSVSVRNLIRLASLTQDDKYRKAAQATLEAFAAQLKSNPRGMTTMALAMGEFLDNRDYRSLTQRVRDKQQSDAIAKATAERMAAEEAAAAADAAANPPAPEKRPPLGAVTGEVAPSVPSSEQAGRRTEPSRGVVQTSGQTPQTGQTQAPSFAGTSNGTGASKPAAPERVKAEAFLSADELVPGSTCRIVVALTIAPEWHINANPASPDYLIPTTVAYRSDSGVTLGNLKYPKHEELPLKDSDAVSHVYGGKVLIEGDLQIPADLTPGTEKFELHIRYQACNEAQCERPQTLKFAGSIPIAGAAQ